MIAHLTKLSLSQKRTTIAAYSIGGFAALLLYVAIYPSMQGQIDSYNQLVKSFPPALMKAFGADTTLSNFEGLIGTKLFGFMWPLLCIFLVSSLAGSALAGEIEKSTLGLWLTAPLSRLQIYWSKVIATLVGLAMFVVASVLTVLPVAAAFNVSVNARHILLLSIIGYLLGCCVAGMAFLASAMFSEKSKVYMSVGVILLVMYVVNIVASLVTSLADLRYTSLLYYYNSGDILSGKPINWLNVFVFIIIGLTCLLAGAHIFRKRDISL